MKLRKLCKCVSIILILSIIIQLLPPQVFAAETDGASAPQNIALVGEVEALRDESTKHFRLSDGSYIAVSYGMPVHYLDSTGNWQDINNEPVAAMNSDEVAVYQIATPNTSIQFSAELTDGQLVTASYNESAVAMRLLDTTQAAEIMADAELTESDALSYDRNVEAQVCDQDTAPFAAIQTEDWQVEDLIPDTLVSSIIYEDVFPG